jgi:cytidylate kinase
VAEKLSRVLGYECISREILLEASEEFDTPEIKLIRALHDAPSVLDRLGHGKERYISYLKSALLQHARKDNMVYHGLAGQYFLRDIPHVLKVRIIVDMQDRVREEMRRENIPAEKAAYILRKDDQERRKWGLQIYGTDTWDSLLYDLVLHIGRLTVDDAVNIIFKTVSKPAFQPTGRSRKLVEDMALAAKVKADLVRLAPQAEIAADDGKIFIKGIAYNANTGLIEKIKAAAEQIQDVVRVYINLPETNAQRDHINPFHNVG